jgi:hypothetical protein
MRKALLLFLMAFIGSCHPPNKEEADRRTKQMLATQVRDQTIAQLRKEKGLCVCGIGSSMLYQIKKLSIYFHYYNEIDIEQARELLMAAGTLLLDTTNANEQIRPFLQNYPFKPENIEIRIYIQKPNGREPDLGKLTIASIIDGILRYKIDNPETNGLKTIYEETFEEAKLKA